MTQLNEVKRWLDRNVVDPSGRKVGTASQIFVEDVSHRPQWVAVNTGLFGRRSSFVPIEGARLEGDDLVIPWDRAQVKDAPQVDDDGNGHLTPDEEVQLYRHYARQQRATAGPDGSECDAPKTEKGQDESNPGFHDRGQTRLRRYVVTEEVNPVSRVLVEDLPADASGEPQATNEDQGDRGQRSGNHQNESEAS